MKKVVATSWVVMVRVRPEQGGYEPLSMTLTLMTTNDRENWVSTLEGLFDEAHHHHRRRRRRRHYYYYYCWWLL